MKKFTLMFLLLFFINSSANAIVTPEETTSVQFVINHGHSGEMAKLIDLQKAQINNTNPTYIKYEKQIDLSDYPAWVTQEKVDAVKDFIKYLDCGLDNGTFGKMNIDYSNSKKDY